MLRTLEGFGIDTNVDSEPWSVDGRSGWLAAPSDPIDVGESGLTARIAMVMATMTDGVTTIEGQGRLNQRPIEPLVDALSTQGISVTTAEQHLPASVQGQGGLWGESIDVDCSASSQFATALMVGAPTATNPTSLRIVGLAGSNGYLQVTADVMSAFGASPIESFIGFDIDNDGYKATDYLVESDASASVYPLVATAIVGGRVVIPDLGVGSRQPDVVIARHLADMGCEIEHGDQIILEASGGPLAPIDADLSAAPDGALALAVACLFSSGTSRISGLHTLRHKESDRLETMASELGRLGAGITIEDDGLVITPESLTGTTIDPHGDHRVAMSVALAGLRIPGVVVADSEVVNKTWPEFWDMLSSLG